MQGVGVSLWVPALYLTSVTEVTKSHCPLTRTRTIVLLPYSELGNSELRKYKAVASLYLTVGQRPRSTRSVPKQSVHSACLEGDVIRGQKLFSDLILCIPSSTGF